MSKPSHIPLFPDSYLRDTMHLTTEEHGAYLLLFMAAWSTEDCSLPNDDKRLAALAKLSLARWRKIAPTILEFWTIDKGRIRQKRLLKEWHYVRDKSAKRRAAADARWSQETASKCNANALHLGEGEGEGESEGGPNQANGLSLGRGDISFRVLDGGAK